jgi:8-oxo-dGTP pyrophosphatase MutT (NUDIX family)
LPPEAIALREIKEELGIKPFLKLIGFVGQSRYKFQDYTDKRMHFKRVNLFVFSSKKMANLLPQTSEGFVDAKWLKVEDAVRKLAFDKKLLLKAATIYKNSKQETKQEIKAAE